MFIRSLQIINYRGILLAEFDQLAETVIVAGPNGSGKSCVLDAIRLLKSAYGGYRPNEVQSFLGEFQINLHRDRSGLLQLFQDRRRPLRIRGEFALTEMERSFLRTNAHSMLENQAWDWVAPQRPDVMGHQVLPIATTQRARDSHIADTVREGLSEVEAELSNEYHTGMLEISVDGELKTEESRVLELLFGNYVPQHLGVIDYHGASRSYQRETLSSINLDVQSTDDRMRNHALYDYMNKYSNLKSQMASEYIKELLQTQLSGVPSSEPTLVSTMQQMFKVFFPGKEFLGPSPNATSGLEFPVRTQSGATHDIDDLSSGEKELLYGYLRLRNSTPRNSVVLIDEPELHLNPRLLSGLASFYHEHIGRSLGNQLWLVTHSDALIRDAVGKSGIQIFHMQAAQPQQEANQISELKLSEDLDKIVVDLVGDMAAYRPEAKIVIVEGGGNSEFDARMIRELFPAFASQVTLIPGGNKRRVRDLYETLQPVQKRGAIPGRFFAIVDRDDDEIYSPSKEELGRLTRTSWPVYHIENFLLSDEHIFFVLKDLLHDQCLLSSVQETADALRSAAAKTIHSLLVHRTRLYADKLLHPAVELRFDPNSNDIASTLSQCIQRVARKVQDLASGGVSESELRTFENNEREKLEQQLQDNTWRNEFRGRDVLRKFLETHCRTLPYDGFINLVISKMKSLNYEPPQMAVTLAQIVAD